MIEVFDSTHDTNKNIIVFYGLDKPSNVWFIDVNYNVPELTEDVSWWMVPGTWNFNDD